MNKFSSRILSLILTLVMLMGVMPLSVFATDGSMTVNVESVNAMPGESVEVDIALANNPGISSFKINVRYGDILTLTKVQYNSEFGGQFVPPQSMSNPVTLYWLDYSSYSEVNGVFATLTFTVSDSAEADSVADITVTYDPDDIYDFDMENVNTVVNAGSVTVLPCVPGDINGDGKSNNKDATTMGRFLAEWDVDINAHCIDINGDGTVNNKDLTRLFQYLANWDVEIWCKCGSYTRCNHEMTATVAKDPTCTEDGNIAYWYCELCGRYFLDADGAAQTTLDTTVLEKTGHDVYVKEAKAPTYTEWGWTEGSWCLACGEVFTESVDLEPIAGYSITYSGILSDPYLAQSGIVNNNPTEYYPGQTFNFESPSKVPEGCEFAGWYDAYGDPFKGVTADTTGNIEVRAHWKWTEYKIQYVSTMISDDGNKFETPSDAYTTNMDKLLPAPELDGYIFAGWSDDDGNIYTRLPMGTTGHKIFTSNWLSERNMAWSKQDYGEPIINEEDNTIVFAYEIGEIRNVPMSLVVDYGKINEDGVPITKTTTYSTTTSKTEMENYTDFVSKATTESFGWTLSSEWSEGVSVSESWLEENEMTLEEAESICTNESSNWYVSSGKSGTDTKETLDTKDVYDLETTTHNTKTYDTKDQSTRQDFSAGLELGYKLTTGLDVGVNGGVNGKIEKDGATLGANLGGELGLSIENEFSAGLDLKYEKETTTSSKTGTEKDNGGSDESGSISHKGTTTTKSSSWNQESGYGGSSSVTNERSVNKGLSQKIAQSTNYGKEYIGTEGESNSQDFENAETSSKEYSSSVTYDTTVYEEVTESYTTENTKRGYHRRVMAGTAHVYGVVGYDIESDSYFVYTMSIMDDKTYPMEDYSFVSNEFNDNQSTVLDFEVPYDIFDYVGNRVCATKGLEVDANGVITAYTGEDTTVVIPEYVRTNGTNSVVKVTGLSANAFMNKANIELVVLSDYITAIPDDAFSGCSSLVSIEGKSVSSIGKRAFAGCTSLKFGMLGDNITYLGEKAFDGLDTMSVNAANASIIEAAVNSGARQIEIVVSDNCTDLEAKTLCVPDTTEVFAFDGNGKVFNNVIIESYAQKTYLFDATFNSTGKTPVTIHSPEVVLAEVNINACGIGLIFTEDAKLSLYGESYVNTEKSNAMLCKNITLEKIVISEVSYYSHLHVNGMLLVCGEIPTGDLLTVRAPWLSIVIDEEMFEKYKLGEIKIAFNVNGGDEVFGDKTIYYGDAYGELPVPTRDYYNFDGWYTAVEGGELITADMKPESVEDIFLYAHWTLNPVSDWVLESELPEGAEVIDEKWTYTLREYDESSSTTMEGWTHYDTKRTGWGAWSGWLTWNPDNGVRNVEWRSAYDHTEYHYYHWTNGKGAYTYKKDSTYWLEEKWFTYILPTSQYGTSLGYVGTDNGANVWARADYSGNYSTDKTFTRSVNRTEWRYQDPIYTYYFYRDLHNLEKNYDPSGESNVSNVVKYVKYREK